MKLDHLVKKKNGIEFRKQYGMNISEQYVTDVINQEKIDTDFESLIGTPLTTTELEEYNVKNKVKDDVPALESILVNSPESFSGIYFKPEKGTIVVQTTKDPLQIKDSVLNNVKNKEKIEFEKVRFSNRDIELARKKIMDGTNGSTVEAIIPDTMKNKLLIALNEVTNEKKDYIKSLVDNSDLIHFISSIKKKPMSDTSDYGNNYPLGTRINGYDSQGIGVGGCSAGYEGALANSTRVLVTAGHCNQVGVTNSWFQPSNANGETSIGNFGFRTSSDSDIANAAADVGYIPITGDTSTPFVAFPDSTTRPNPNRTPIKGVYVNDLVGDTTYSKGATSGFLRGGTIKYANVTSWSGYSEYGWNHNENWVSWVPEPGDSGGVVVANYRYDSNAQSWFFSLAGTTSATITIGEDDSEFVEPGTYGIYVPVWASFSELNLDGIELVQ